LYKEIVLKAADYYQIIVLIKKGGEPEIFILIKCDFEM